jgi:SAM-dependent methyltransferase
MGLLITGNTAKLYCLNWIEQFIRSKNGDKVTLLDLGCGTAQGFVELLRRYPQVRYVGVEPLASSFKQAQRNLTGLNGTTIRAYAYGIDRELKEKFDIIISFSTLEHVYRRAEYFRVVKACLKPNGYLLINYDAGHFRRAIPKDKLKNILGPILARLGKEQYYQAFVSEKDFARLIDEADLRIVEAKFFNTDLKGVYKVIPEASRDSYMQKWLDFELWLNEQGIIYNDLLAGTFLTRNYIVTHK